MALPTNKHGQPIKSALLFFIWIGVLSSAAGCISMGDVQDTATQVLSDFGWKDKAVAQTFGVIPFGNDMPWVADQLHTEFLARLAEALEDKCGRVILVGPGDDQYPYELGRFIPSGSSSPDNIALAEICRKARLNGAMTGRLAQVRTDEGSQGMLWFRKNKLMARIQLEIVLYHSGTAAKVMDQTFFIEVELTEEEYNALTDEKVLSASATEDELERASFAAARRICNRIKDIPWEGDIIMVQGDKALIPFGNDIGLAVGDELEIFQKGRIFEAKGGSRYIVPGISIGTAEIIALSADQSEIVVLEKSGEITIGDIVRKIE